MGSGLTLQKNEGKLICAKFFSILFKLVQLQGPTSESDEYTAYATEDETRRNAEDGLISKELQ